MKIEEEYHRKIKYRAIEQITRNMVTNMEGVRAYASKQHQGQENKQEWAFVPSCWTFMDGLERILYNNKVWTDITDLGCGISPVLLYLSSKGFTGLKGVDNETKYLRVLKSLLPPMNPPRLHKKNLCYFDRELKRIIYRSKAIYLYMPLTDYEKFQKLLDKIWEHMSPGALLISFYATDFDRGERAQHVHSIKSIKYFKKPGP